MCHPGLLWAQVMADQQAATLQTQQMLRQLRQELRQQLPGTGMEQSQAFQRLEVKLSALEGSVLSAGQGGSVQP